ncbi:MAG: bifunctional methionine sulfoxide reductase B/A protein [Planctomycetota bacterium]
MGAFMVMQRVIVMGLVLPVLLAVPLALVVIAPGSGWVSGSASGSEQGVDRTVEGSVRVSVFTTDGELVGPLAMPRLELTEAEWRERLTEEQYRILRTDGTEAAFCGTLLDNKKEGVYSCAGCALPLFSSEAKFTSGTGWPSFFQPIAEGNVAEKADISFGMVRTEIECARCDGHLGHVFEDGPAPTGRRHCLNSESLVFTESSELASLGEVRQAVIAGGCFWCVEAVFEELAGVVDVVSGYAGGSDSDADYKKVITGTTGHAEAVRITYRPAEISFADLLKVHFATHDPTTLNRQGADVGPQYRSAIFYANAEEKEIAETFIEELTELDVFDGRAIVTTLESLADGAGFHLAEAYHQDYVCNNPMNGYVRAVAMPKVEKVRDKFADKLKEQPQP